MPKDKAEKRQGIPYGPTQGIVEGLALLQRLSPSRVDTELLRAQKIAPGNEYKVVGALKFLGVLDDQGQPTPSSRRLKTRGPAFTQAFQDMLRNAYKELFDTLDLSTASRDDIYNFFVSEMAMGSEMAQKATRSFLELSRLADIPLNPRLQERPRRGRPRRPSNGATPSAPSSAREPAPQAPQQASTSPITVEGVPFILALTPEVAALDEDTLTDMFRKLRSALRRSAEE